MVQLGVTDNPKEKALKLPPPADSTVVVLQSTAPPTAKKSCCTRRVIICISVTCFLLAMTIACVLLALYVRRDSCLTYWGPCEPYYLDFSDDIVYDSDFSVWNHDDVVIQSSDYSSSGSSVTIIENIMNGEWQDGGHEYEGEWQDGGPLGEAGSQQVDPSGEHVPGQPLGIIVVPPEMTQIVDYVE
ncbi:uncharacterized protein LOC117299362 [Asterias rubens]|uniref:uncharacterized protein LOC117299362 n=1 Tax=Asterias rubens TaxID=7604 RepID=UPI00145544A6|nr:uncharacterized protein LOC117299362 [Asterias rubens]